jgi:hypothetical protein
MNSLRSCSLIILFIPLLMTCNFRANGTQTNTSTDCLLQNDTTETTTVNDYECALLTRDTSECEEEREDEGLSGFWLKFSCRVTLEVSGSNVVITTDSQPDYKSYYFATDDTCYEPEDLDDRTASDDTIAVQAITMTVPLNPVEADDDTAVSSDIVGIALNGVAIFANVADVEDDDVYDEPDSYDGCEGHVDSTGTYHYHTEPNAITNGDDGFVGVMRDGFPIYGRFSHVTSSDETSLDEAGGHYSTTDDSTLLTVYHYHIHSQTDGTNSAYFISSGFYAGTPGSCTGCD